MNMPLDLWIAWFVFTPDCYAVTTGQWSNQEHITSRFIVDLCPAYPGKAFELKKVRLVTLVRWIKNSNATSFGNGFKTVIRYPHNTSTLFIGLTLDFQQPISHTEFLTTLLCFWKLFFLVAPFLERRGSRVFLHAPIAPTYYYSEIKGCHSFANEVQSS